MLHCGVWEQENKQNSSHASIPARGSLKLCVSSALNHSLCKSDRMNKSEAERFWPSLLASAAITSALSNKVTTARRAFNIWKASPPLRHMNCLFFSKIARREDRASMDVIFFFFIFFFSEAPCCLEPSCDCEHQCLPESERGEGGHWSLMESTLYFNFRGWMICHEVPEPEKSACLKEKLFVKLRVSLIVKAV